MLTSMAAVLVQVQVLRLLQSAQHLIYTIGIAQTLNLYVLLSILCSYVFLKE